MNRFRWSTFQPAPALAAAAWKTTPAEIISVPATAARRASAWFNKGTTASVATANAEERNVIDSRTYWRRPSLTESRPSRLHTGVSWARQPVTE